MVIDVGDSVLLQYGSWEIIRVVLASREKMFQDGGAFETVKISEDSPVGQAMKGRRQGEQFEVEVNGEKSTYHVLGVKKGCEGKVKLADTWGVLTDGKILFAGEEEVATTLYNQLNDIVPRLSLQYIDEGEFPEDAYLSNIIINSVNEAEQEEAQEIRKISTYKYKPRTLNYFKKEHSKDRSPRKNVIKNLLAKSENKEFNAACGEWVYEGDVILEEESDFEGNCELCKQGGLKTNYVIHNERNPEKSFKVGSSCITRFLRLNASSSIDESNLLFAHLANIGLLAKKIRPLVLELGMDEIYEDTLIRIMAAVESLSKHSKPSENDISRLIMLMDIDQTSADRLRKLFNGQFKQVREQVKIKKIKDYSNKVWSKVKASVRTTLAGSEAYKNPHKNIKE